MRFMTKRGLAALAGLAAVAAADAQTPQPPGVTRTELQRHDLSTPGREAIQVRVAVAPGVTFPDHTPSGRGDHLRPRRHVRISGRGPAGDGRGRRGPVHPGGNGPFGAQRRQRQCGRARDLYRREGTAAASVLVRKVRKMSDVATTRFDLTAADRRAASARSRRSWTTTNGMCCSTMAGGAVLRNLPHREEGGRL